MNTLLILGAMGSLAVSLLHFWIAWRGAPAYRFFGAGEEMAKAAEKGSPAPALVTLGIALVFAVFGWYALGATGFAPTLPFQTAVLWGIGGIYTLRGLVVLLEVAWLRQGKPVAAQNPWFSLASLAIGLVHLLGMMQEGNI